MNRTTEDSLYNRRMLRDFLRGSRLFFLLSMLASALSALVDLVAPQIIRIAVDHVIGGAPADRLPAWAAGLLTAAERQGTLQRQIAFLTAALLLVALGKVLSQFGYEVSKTVAAETLVKTMRDRLFSHLERLPYAWHMHNSTGDIIQRCTSDIETLKNFLAEQMTNLIRIVILLLLSLSFMLGMDLHLTLIAMLPVPVIILYSFHFHRRIGEAFLDCDENEGLLSAIAQENLTGVRIVRAFGRERYEQDRFEAQNSLYTAMWMKLARPLAAFWSIGDILSGLQILLTVVFGALFCLRGRMRPGTYLAFLSYCAMMTWPVRMLGRMIADMSKAGISLDRIRAIMQAPEEEDPGRRLTPEIRGEIVFDHVSFAYEESAEVLHDVSFRIPAGTTLGILGGTGSGKSTLVMLLDKLYELSDGQGQIRVDGVDIRDIRTDHLRQSIGMVLQEPFLFSRTLAENIASHDGEASHDQIRQAARAACLDDTVMGFAKGYDTLVGERGLTLSGGQKQRTAIARTLIRQTPILIFDDSLSAVDTETDAKIRSSLEARFGSATVILISHRITTLSKADRILVLDHGRISEQGSHDELKNAGGLYQRICAIQSGSGEAAG